MTETYRVYTHDQRPELREQRRTLSGAWADFMYEDEVANRYWDNLYSDFPQFQFYILDDEEKLIAEGNTIPFTWDGTLEGLSERGWDATIETGVKNYAGNIPPNTLSAMAATISPAQQGKGISQLIIKTMKGLAQKYHLGAFVAPVRPSHKTRYPLTPIERYITWKHDDGESPFDPWLRTHWRVGAKIMKVAPQSMTIRGTIADWEKWTEMRFPESGAYIVPFALVPVEIDRERDEGVYVEPNVWMQHRLEE